MGGTVFVSSAQAVFSNSLLRALAIYSPDVNAGQVLAIGATELKTQFSQDILPKILHSYMVGLKDAFLFGTIVAGCAFLASWIAPIKSIIKRGESTRPTTDGIA